MNKRNTNTNTPDTMKNTPDNEKEGRNETMNNTEKNTAPETMNTNTENTEKKEGKSTMKNKNTRPAPKKNTAPADKKQVSLDDNIKQFRATLSGDVKNLARVLNEKTTGNYSMIDTRVKSARETVRKDLSALNNALAIRYYRSAPLFDIVRAGENSVPAVAVTETEKGGKYTVKAEDVKVKPTLSGMKSAGVIGEEEVNRVDLLRRMVAYVKSGCTAPEYLTGKIDGDEKKDVPNKKVAEMIAAVGTPSKNKARGIMTQVFRDLTGNAYKKEVFPKLYDEFEGYITRRGKEWGTRAIVGTATANDMALEFANMYFNNKTAMKYIVE